MNHINLNLKLRIFLFFMLSAASAVKLNTLKSLSNLTPEYLTLNGVYPWAVLFLCVVFLFTKRHGIQITEISPEFVFGGVAVVVSGFFLPSNAPEFEVFRLLLTWVGLAFIFFGEAASFYAILLCIYGFGISFSKLVGFYLGSILAAFAAWVTYQIGHLFFPISLGDSAIFMWTSQGERVLLLINASCSGTASMSVFLVIFMLMSLDMPLPDGKWAFMLLFGIIGTVLQNNVRLFVLLFSGYYFGPDALVYSESVAGYVIFPLWYMLFALVYMKYAKKYSFL